MVFWERPTDCLVLCLLSKFYSSGDPLFLGQSPSPAFSTNELFLVPTGFGAISRPIRCLQSNSCPDRAEFGPTLKVNRGEKGFIQMCLISPCLHKDWVISYLYIHLTLFLDSVNLR